MVVQVKCQVPGHQVPYLQPGSVLDHSDLRVVAKGGFYFDIPLAMMAAVSPMLKSALHEVFSRALEDSLVTLVTDVPCESLACVLRFVLSGRLPEKMDAQAVTCFNDFGINIRQLKFLPNDAESDVSAVDWLNASPSDDLDIKFKVYDRSDPAAAAPQALVKQEASVIGAAAVATGTASGPDSDVDMLDMKDPLYDDILEDDEDGLDDNMDFYSLDPGQHLEVKQEDGDPLDFDYDPDDEMSAAIAPKSKRKRKGSTRALPISRSDGTIVKHVGVKKKCKFDNCDFAVIDSLVFEQHLLTHRVMDRELDPNMYYCTTISCLKEFRTLDEWKMHCKALHGNKFHPCLLCDKAFSRARVREYHVMKEHQDMNSDKFDYDCPQCGTKFTRKAAYAKHLKYENKYHNNTCAYKDCDVTFTTWEEHQAHLNESHNGVLLHICGVCTETFASRVLRKKHRLAAHPEEMSPFYKQCDICGEHTGSMKSHKALKHGIEESGFCVICEKEVKDRFKHQSQYHWKTSDGGNKYSPCPTCGKMVNNMKKHNCQDPEESLTCEVCHDTFSNKVSLANHTRARHGSVQEYKCSECTKICSSASGLKQHMNLIHGKGGPKGSFACPYCPKICTTNAGKYFHINTTHTYPYDCKNCRVRFKTPEELEKHEQNPCDIVSGNKQFASCEHCGKVMRKNKLRVHIFNQHTPEEKKPYRCHLCPKGFGRQKCLEEHINTHTNSRPFKCQLCDAAFNSSCSLSTHEIKVHNRARKKATG